ncbi:hypothetical protein R3P38DRAFT_3491748, partial [Favolaschia claudopus]
HTLDPVVDSCHLAWNPLILDDEERQNREPNAASFEQALEALPGYPLGRDLSTSGFSFCPTSLDSYLSSNLAGVVVFISTASLVLLVLLLVVFIMVKSCVCGFTPKGGRAALSNHVNKCRVLLARREAAATHNVGMQAAAAAAPTEDPGPIDPTLPAKGKNKRVVSDEDYAEMPGENANTAKLRKRNPEAETVEVDTLARALAAAQSRQVTELQKQLAQTQAAISAPKEKEGLALQLTLLEKQLHERNNLS